MSAVQSVAIVIHVTEFSETSCVVTLLTREYGKITGLAKGARRKKSAFESALDLLSVVRLVFLPKAPRAMDLLTEAKLERRFRAGTWSLGRLYRAYCVAELIQRLVELNDPMPAVYDLTDRALIELEGDSDPDLTLVRFEMKLLDQLGHRPQFDQCVSCGRARTGSAERVHVGLLAGGAICPQCRSGHRQVISVRSETLDWLGRLVESDADTSPTVTWSPLVRGEATELLSQYIAHLAGRPMRLHVFLKTHGDDAGPRKERLQPARGGADTDVDQAKP